MKAPPDSANNSFLAQEKESSPQSHPHLLKVDQLSELQAAVLNSEKAQRLAEFFSLRRMNYQL